MFVFYSRHTDQVEESRVNGLVTVRAAALVLSYRIWRLLIVLGPLVLLQTHRFTSIVCQTFQFDFRQWGLADTPLDVQWFELIEPRQHTSTSYSSQNVGTYEQKHLTIVKTWQSTRDITRKIFGGFSILIFDIFLCIIKLLKEERIFIWKFEPQTPLNTPKQAMISSFGWWALF